MKQIADSHILYDVHELDVLLVLQVISSSYIGVLYFVGYPRPCKPVLSPSSWHLFS